MFEFIFLFDLPYFHNRKQSVNVATAPHPIKDISEIRGWKVEEHLVITLTENCHKEFPSSVGSGEINNIVILVAAWKSEWFVWAAKFSPTKPSISGRGGSFLSSGLNLCSMLVKWLLGWVVWRLLSNKWFVITLRLRALLSAQPQSVIQNLCKLFLSSVDKRRRLR